MNTVFFGSGSFALASFTALCEAERAPCLVVTQPPRRRRRRGKLEPTLVHTAAKERGIEVATPPKVNTPESLERLAVAEADLFLVAEYGQILSRQLLAIPRLGTLNVHGSLLPRWRGAIPVIAALLAGDEATGVTIQRTVFELDAGPMLLKREVAIGAREDRGSLFARLATLGGSMLVEVVQRFAAGDPPAEVNQDETQATFCKRLRGDDTWLDWTEPAAALERKVRALAPQPGAKTQLLREDGIGIEVGTSELATDVALAAAEPGHVVAVASDSFDVAAGEGALRVLSLKPAGRKMMTASAFLNGYRLRPGERFGPRPAR